MRGLHSIFHNKYLKSVVYFTFKSHLNSGAKLSSKILDLYLDFIKFIVKKADSHTQYTPK